MYIYIKPARHTGRKGKTSMEESGSMRLNKKMRFDKSEEGEIGYLPSDVLSDVLSRLPVKDLSRFKCVSKGWLHLIKDDNFVQRHLIRSTENGKGRFLRVCSRRMADYHEATARFYKLEEGEDVYKMVNVGKVVPFAFPTLPPSCNGLLCYMSSVDYLIHVCNPITTETTTLPKPNFLVQNQITDFQALSLKVLLGIGYVSSEKKYKVMVAWSTPTDSGVEIYTLGGTESPSSWRPVSCKQYGLLLSDYFVRHTAPAYANGAMYWYMNEFYKNKYGEELPGYPTEIISFNFAQEKFHLIPVPKDVNRFRHICWIFELRGHLCLLQRPKCGPTLKMWMLKHDNQWVTQKIPPDLVWVGTVKINTDGWMTIVRQDNNQEETPRSCVYNFEGKLIKPTELYPCFLRFGFEVGQFHQESLVSLTSI